MLFTARPASANSLREDLRAVYRTDESDCVNRLLDELRLPASTLDRIAERARALVVQVRKERNKTGGLDAFLHEYGLSTQEGVVLMCLAEALLRVPDEATIDKLIKDKLSAADWEKHLGHSDSLFVNASTWALMLTGRVVRLDEQHEENVSGVLRRLVHRSGAPVIRNAVHQAMKILGRQFVMGRNIQEAIKRAQWWEKRGYSYSYDMLGEAARTQDDAERYFKAYQQAIAAIGKAGKGKSIAQSPGISVKLSALHPRYEFAQSERVMTELAPRLKALCLAAKQVDIGLNIDAEEADRLDSSLEVIEAVSADAELAAWDGLGVVVQAYQKRAPYVLDWLADMAHRHKRRLMLRLVKGAYWDMEIKRSQEQGLAGYPVFTRKVNTDVSYLACAKRLFANADAFYPQFATHNAHTVAAVIELAGNNRDYEFQRLHGMGEEIYDQLVGDSQSSIACRIYAPVGSHEELLAYLVRRLLENGANTSFVNRIVDEAQPIDEIIADPIAQARRLERIPHPRIPLPRDLYGAERPNSEGVDLSDVQALVPLAKAMDSAAGRLWEAMPIIGGLPCTGTSTAITDPADRSRQVGTLIEAQPAHIEDALHRAQRAAPGWDATAADTRAACLERAADLMEQNRADILALCVREAGKTLLDAVAELREAVDFCRYYAARARADFSAPIALPGPTGEQNQIALHGRGVFLCISPWNFPLAIFTGQVTAALAAGNAVIAKPAEQTPLIAAYAVRLLHQAGVPGDVLHLLPGDGPSVAGPLVADPRIAGIAFTGSTETARLINRTLAERDGPIVPLIAETGGQNAMLVDSTALPEQVVKDVLASAFQSAGQRCSALRVLFVQTDVADKILTMLTGAMRELSVGDPSFLHTDIGPVIDADARAILQAHAERMEREAKLLCRTELGPECQHGTFFAPVAYEIDRLDRLEREVFGPVLHIIRYRADDLDAVLNAIKNTGYGLTLGIHTRIDSTVSYICERLPVGNTYVNRNQIGAIVGVQPFGGHGLSGTGPKAGGPFYLHRFASERTLSIDTTAAGGNASLLSLVDDRPV